MNGNGTDWNRHGGVGATLLENWVEERSVGEKILLERDLRRLNRTGHVDVLIQNTGKINVNEAPHRSVAQTTYTYDNDKKKPGLGKRRALIEAELLTKAIGEVRFRATRPTAREWKSTTHKDFHKSFVPALDLDNPEKQYDSQAAARYNHPITYWSSEYRNGEIVASTSVPQYRTSIERQRLDHQYFYPGHAAPGSITFGKHTDFSTPIKDYVKSPIKDL